MLKFLEPPVNYSWSLHFVTGREVHDARNDCVLDAKRMKAKYLMFIDDDTLIPTQGLRRLVYLMEQHPEWDLLSGVYVTKSNPPQVLIFKDGPGPSWDWEFDTQFPITGCGLGCCLIRMDAFDKVPEPWFDWIEGGDGLNRFSEGEDLYFCRKLEEAGGTLMADGGLLCGHINKDGEVFSIPLDSAPLRNGAERLKEAYTVIDATETIKVEA